VTISRARLAAGAAALGFPLSDAQLALFDRYAALLIEGAARLSLTTLTEPDAIVDKHFLDSLSVLAVVPRKSRRVIDVGSGAGSPGVVLKIARPSLELHLLEATRKKADWLLDSVRELGLEGIEVAAERAETLAHDPRHRERYDVAMARAVAPLAALCELCLPFVTASGRFVAQKSAAGAAAEVPAAGRATKLLRGSLAEVRPVEHAALPNRVLVVIEKVGVTPNAYPRRPGMPAKRPL